MDHAWTLLDTVSGDLRVIGDRLAESVLAFFNKKGADMAAVNVPGRTDRIVWL